MFDTKTVEAFEFHHSMLIDEVRMNRFLRAILQTVKPGDVVLDIGSGTGILACFCCLAGAKHVYAIEQGPIIGLAREICAYNDLQDRITFFNDWSTHIELPEPANVLVTETIGNIGFEEGILRWTLDAKKRLLTENARIIPQTLEMFAIPIESEADYHRVDNWNHYYYTFDFSPLRTLASSNLLWLDLMPEMFLSEPASLLSADLAQVAEGDFSAETSYVVKREGTVHGIGGWFTAELTPTVTLSNVPPNKTPSWSHTFMPLEWPLHVQAGDTLHLKIHTTRNATQWQWQVTHFTGRRDNRDGQETIFPEQTTNFGQLVGYGSTQELSSIPARNMDGEITLFILQRINGTLTIAEIARQTEEKFPQAFSSDEQLLEHVNKLVLMYSRAGNSRRQSG
jgi:protein arginine N-methyltransferase 1